MSVNFCVEHDGAVLTLEHGPTVDSDGCVISMEGVASQVSGSEAIMTIALNETDAHYLVLELLRWLQYRRELANDLSPGRG